MLATLMLIEYESLHGNKCILFPFYLDNAYDHKGWSFLAKTMKALGQRMSVVVYSLGSRGYS